MHITAFPPTLENHSFTTIIHAPKQCIFSKNTHYHRIIFHLTFILMKHSTAHLDNKRRTVYLRMITYKMVTHLIVPPSTATNTSPAYYDNHKL